MNLLINFYLPSKVDVMAVVSSFFYTFFLIIIIFYQHPSFIYTWQQRYILEEYLPSNGSCPTCPLALLWANFQIIKNEKINWIFGVWMEQIIH